MLLKLRRKRRPNPFIAVLSRAANSRNSLIVRRLPKFVHGQRLPSIVASDVHLHSSDYCLSWNFGDRPRVEKGPYR
jgi:hypothetical protein